MKGELLIADWGLSWLGVKGELRVAVCGIVVAGG